MALEPCTHAVPHGSWGHHRPHLHPGHRVDAGQQEALRRRGPAHRRGRGDAASRQLRRLRLPGCRPFAEALVEGEALPGKCTVSSDEGRARSPTSSASTSAREDKRVARLACAGGTNVARNHARYDGLRPAAPRPRSPAAARAASGAASGSATATWPAISTRSAWTRTRCRSSTRRSARPAATASTPARRTCSRCSRRATGCGSPASRWRPATSCSTTARSPAPPAAAARWTRRADQMETTSRSSTTSRNHETQTPIQRCPTGAIVWIDPKAGPVKGPAAKKIIRKGTLRDAPT